jgi:cytochrome c oxidase subunit 3
MVMYYVALMTFILIFSSVTMVLAVDAGHQMKDKVILYMFLTIIGGGIFVGSQAWEWKNFIRRVWRY